VAGGIAAVSGFGIGNLFTAVFASHHGVTWRWQFSPLLGRGFLMPQTSKLGSGQRAKTAFRLCWAIKTVAVEQWLKTLVTMKFGDSEPPAGGTREKIRDAMGSVFNHAIRWELTDRNPIAGPTRGSGVRVSGKRERTPDILEVEEMQKLLAGLGLRERAMVFLDMPSGLRRGELAGLQWGKF
jgi:integrase